MLARRANLVRGKSESVSELLERIGTYQIGVDIPGEEAIPTPKDEDYVDTDGLSTQECYELGVRDFILKRRPQFFLSNLNGHKNRLPLFEEAYLEGYLDTFKQQEKLDSTSPLPYDQDTPVV